MSRRPIAPADRAGVRRFAAAFGVLRAVGARVHLAEPAETAGPPRGQEARKTDRADARHLRELLME